MRVTVATSHVETVYVCVLHKVSEIAHSHELTSYSATRYYGSLAQFTVAEGSDSIVIPIDVITAYNFNWISINELIAEMPFDADTTAAIRLVNNPVRTVND